MNAYYNAFNPLERLFTNGWAVGTVFIMAIFFLMAFLTTARVKGEEGYYYSGKLPEGLISLRAMRIIAKIGAFAFGFAMIFVLCSQSWNGFLQYSWNLFGGGYGIPGFGFSEIVAFCGVLVVATIIGFLVWLSHEVGIIARITLFKIIYRPRRKDVKRNSEKKVHRSVQSVPTMD